MFLVFTISPHPYYTFYVSPPPLILSRVVILYIYRVLRQLYRFFSLSFLIFDNSALKLLTCLFLGKIIKYLILYHHKKIHPLRVILLALMKKEISNYWSCCSTHLPFPAPILSSTLNFLAAAPYPPYPSPPSPSSPSLHPIAFSYSVCAIGGYF